jgi:hypothetical protein
MLSPHAPVSEKVSVLLLLLLVLAQLLGVGCGRPLLRLQPSALLLCPCAGWASLLVLVPVLGCASGHPSVPSQPASPPGRAGPAAADMTEVGD